MSEEAQRRKARVRNYLDDIKRDGACVDCGMKDHRVLDFDHIDPATKLFSVGATSKWQSIGRVMAEVEKCVLRCANCHRIRSWDDNIFGAKYGHWEQT